MSDADENLLARLVAFRRFPLDGGLLLFDRDSGWNVLLDGPELSGCRAVAPRSLQFAITNGCNLACGFCSRDLGDQSRWTVESAFAFLQEMATRGVLEVAFGGGEPFAFKGFGRLVRRLYDETPLAINVTTNGHLCTTERLEEVAGKVGQIRVSVYDDGEWRQAIRRILASGTRVGANLLLTPSNRGDLWTIAAELRTLGCRDLLLLGYKGDDVSMLLSGTELLELERDVRLLSTALGMELKLDICWGSRLSAVPQVLRSRDCGAGRDFLVVTSEGQVSPCSFHGKRWAAGSPSSALDVWNDPGGQLRQAAGCLGCARTEPTCA